VKTKISFKSGAAKKVIGCLGILLCVGVIWGTLFIRTGRTDLQIFVKAAATLEDGGNVYDLSDANEHTKPPFATLLFVPLTAIPFPWLCRLWDLMNLAAYIGLALIFARRCSFDDVPFLALLGALWTLNSWNQEIRLGQYNVLTMGAIWWIFRAKRALPAGALYAVAVLLKPTNLFFLPLMVRGQRGKLFPFFSGGAALVVFLGSIYAVRYGAAALRTDHFLWLSTLSQTTAKHFLRFDNYSLLKAVAEISSSTILLNCLRLTLAAAIVLVSLRVREGLAAFALTAILTLFLNPLCWFQNFTLLLPGIIWLFSERFKVEGRPAHFMTAAIVFLYLGLQVFNPEVCHLTPKIWEWCTRPLPLYAIVTALVLVFISLRIRRARAAPSPTPS
jgi:hypothetical protein